MEEIWKDIIWYEWLYKISNLWNVKKESIKITRSNKRVFYTKRWIYTYKSNNKYKSIWLLGKHHQIHRLVANDLFLI